jgi:hypothetical protein
MWGKLDNEPRTQMLTGSGKEADATSVEKAIEELEKGNNGRGRGDGSSAGGWMERWDWNWGEEWICKSQGGWMTGQCQGVFTFAAAGDAPWQSVWPCSSTWTVIDLFHHFETPQSSSTFIHFACSRSSSSHPHCHPSRDSIPSIFNIRTLLADTPCRSIK